MSQEEIIGFGLTESHVFDFCSELSDFYSGLLPPNLDRKKFDQSALEHVKRKFKYLEEGVIEKLFQKWTVLGYGIDEIIFDLKRGYL